ncbi:ribosomal-processing cysteine protease Prp [Anaerosphaera multitolerans]|uniref:Ribosomal processing cysteine protease Prp n=1 Tax=Anaerosphaera multitolerans TaxID=2487351 RepID=A0A437S788_9FIRM|nr:ribosomal-processing cysteine protease Prp [Anaerosphaera multitolerans]RVU54920.1 ribosomal-processing cysteine protease Prp [Anaerosphaera multitolerans]
MIEVKLYKRNNNYFGFESKGHADFGNGEYDIVCAAVSILTQTFYFNLVDNSIVENKYIDSKQDKGYLKIILKDNKENDIKVQTNFDFVIKGLELLEAQFSKYIKLEIVEVQ